MRFEWDEEKEKINIFKHGIDFTTAARVFKDDNRLISARKATKQERRMYDDYSQGN